jgi:hypothetical protein
VHCVHNEEILQDDASTAATNSSVTTEEDTTKTFGECLKKIIKEAILSVFKVKVGFPPLWKWVHEIDTGDAKPLRRYSRPLTPLEHESIKEFVKEGLKEGVIEPSDSPWSSPLLPVPKKMVLWQDKTPSTSSVKSKGKGK